MRRKFIQTEVFSRKWAEMGLNDDDLQALEEFLLDNPDAGDTIAETGGAKKVRIPLEGRGKRGGGRVVYVDVVVREVVFLITAYAKNVQVDLSAEQKKAVRDVVRIIMEEGWSMEKQYYDELMEGLEQAAAFVKGDTSKCKVNVVEVPDPIPKYKAGDVARTRKDLNLSQRALARALGVSPRTVEAWEAGRNEPSGAARHLLYLIDTDHALVDRLVIR